MQPRDYRPTGQAISDNLRTFITNHPDAFDCLLFRADTSAIETIAPGTDVVGSLESNERAITYLNPIPARAVKVPDGLPMSASNDAMEPDGFQEQPVVLILNVSDTPKQSIVQYNEYVDALNVRRVNLYIVQSESMGSMPGAGLRHYCIPFQAFDDVVGNKP